MSYLAKFQMCPVGIVASIIPNHYHKNLQWRNSKGKT